MAQSADAQPRSVLGAPASQVRFAEVPLEQVARSLRGGGLLLDLGAMRLRVRSSLGMLAGALRQVYAEFPFEPVQGFFDADVALVRSPGLRGRLRPSLRFLADGLDPFGPQPWNLSLPQLEWGINWCFASLFNQHLLLHAGALELDGTGLLLVGEPGSGKSTLTAALALAGARLLSDEFGILMPAERLLLPLPKPVALKNRSIDLIRGWSAEARLGPVYRKTHKGDVAHLAPDRTAVDGRHAPVQPSLIVFPRWQDGRAASLEEVGAAEAFGLLAGNSFNFTTTAAEGFLAVEWLVRHCEVRRLAFGDLSEAVAVLQELCR